MATFTVTARQQQKTDTLANWANSNPVLLVGEIGIESDTGKIKIGNGITAWNSLAYIGITTEFLEANYMLKSNPVVSGALQIEDGNSKIIRASVSPAGNNIGANGVMISHYYGDEGGLLINEDGAYLWNSTDSGSLFKGIDEDLWFGAELKKDATFSQGLMFDFDSNGNLRLKGNVYINNGATMLTNGGATTASNISVTANANLGGSTNLQTVLNYIANVFAGTQQVTKLKAGTFDTTT